MERSECKKSVSFRHGLLLAHCLLNLLLLIKRTFVQVDETKKCFKGLLETQAQLKALHDAMERMEITYATPESEKETDFKDILEARGQEAGISKYDFLAHRKPMLFLYAAGSQQRPSSQWWHLSSSQPVEEY